MDRLVTETRAGPVGQPGATTTRTYDDYGRLATVTDPTGRTETRTYFNSGWLKSQTFACCGADPADSFTVSHGYDAAGRRIEMTDRRGTTTWDRDPMGRVTRVDHPDEAQTRAEYTWSLSGTPRFVTRSRVEGGSRTEQTSRLSHDANDRLVGFAGAFGGGWLPVAGMDYYADGAIRRQDRLGQGPEVFAYDEARRLTSYASTATTFDDDYTATLAYDVSGRVISEIVDDGATPGTVAKSYTYDDAGQLTSAVHDDSADDADRSWTYGYDQRGQRTTSCAVAAADATCGSGTVTTYAYGDDGALASTETGGVITDYTTDAAGRWTRRETGSRVETYGYDPRGQQVTHTLADGATNSSQGRGYDGDGRLVTLTGAATSLSLTWDSEVFGIAQATELSGTIWGAPFFARYNYGFGRISFNRDGHHWYGHDARGSVLATDEVAGPADYSPFGEPLGSDGPPVFGYRGELHAGGDLAQVHLRARDYEPDTGSFATPDPLGGVDGTTTVTNRFHYADNDPLNKADPLGLRACDDSFRATVAAFNPTATGTEAMIGCAVAPAAIQASCVAAGGDVFLTAAQEVYDGGNPVTGCRRFNPCEGAESWIPGYETATSWACNNGDDIANIARNTLTLLPGYSCYEALTAPNLVDAGLCALDFIPGIGKIDEGADIGRILNRIGSHTDDVGRYGDDVIERGRHAPCVGRLSFSADTEVLMADGLTKPIAEIQVGEEVTATDPETGQVTTETVTRRWVHEDSLVDLELRGDMSITTTEDHPFWSNTAQESQRSDALDLGDELLTATGGTIDTEGLNWSTAHSATAYNLTITGPHTYYVTAGDTPVLVHNCGGLSPNQMNKRIQQGRAPRGISRIDTPKVKGEQLHATFNGGAALNLDGTWKHGSVDLTRKQREWLRANGWDL